MGYSATGILAYGYNLGEEDDNFGLDCDQHPWVNPWDMAEDEAERLYGSGYDDIDNRLESTLLRAQGYGDDDIGDYRRRSELVNLLPVQLTQYGHYDYAGYVLATEVRRRDCWMLDNYAPLLPSDLETDASANLSLNWAMAALGFDITNKNPGWLLTASWG